MRVKCYKCQFEFEPERDERGSLPEKFPCPSCNAKLKIASHKFERAASIEEESELGDRETQSEGDIEETATESSLTGREEGEAQDENDAIKQEEHWVSPVWEKRSGLSLIPSWLITIKDSILDSYNFFRYMPRGEGTGFGNFGYSVWFLGVVINAAFSAYLFNSADGQKTIEEMKVENMPSPELLANFTMAWLFFSPLIALVLMYGLIGLYHLNMTFLQLNRRGFESTFRSVAYGSWPVLLMAIPILLLPIVALFLCFYTHSRALSILHGIPIFKTSLVVLLSWLIAAQAIFVIGMLIMRLVGFSPEGG